MKKQLYPVNGLVEFLRDSWFIIAFVAGVIYWAAKQDFSVLELERVDARITALENRTTVLETGIARLQIKIDDIKADLNLIKGAVIT